MDNKERIMDFIKKFKNYGCSVERICSGVNLTETTVKKHLKTLEMERRATNFFLGPTKVVMEEYSTSYHTCWCGRFLIEEYADLLERLRTSDAGVVRTCPVHGHTTMQKKKVDLKSEEIKAMESMANNETNTNAFSMKGANYE